MTAVVALSHRDYDAVLFDLDGVLTRTASVHASACKKLLVSFLEHRATQAGEPFVPFDISTDCKAVMEAAGIAQLFDTQVDGTDFARLKLRGKPAPDAFLEAARRLRFEPSLFSDTNYLKARYTFCERWEVETWTGTESGLDVFYKINFD